MRTCLWWKLVRTKIIYNTGLEYWPKKMFWTGGLQDLGQVSEVQQKLLLRRFSVHFYSLSHGSNQRTNRGCHAATLLLTELSHPDVQWHLTLLKELLHNTFLCHSQVKTQTQANLLKLMSVVLPVKATVPSSQLFSLYFQFTGLNFFMSFQQHFLWFYLVILAFMDMMCIHVS